MGESSFFDTMISHLRSTSKYYTGYPKDLGPSRVIHFTSEREFVQLLHEGYPVVVAFTIKCNLTKHLDKVLEESAAEFYPHVKFMRTLPFCLTECGSGRLLLPSKHITSTICIHNDAFNAGAYPMTFLAFNLKAQLPPEKVECPKYPGFCITRQKKEYPFIEVFHSPEQASSQGKVADPNITKYSVKVLPFHNDTSAYGFREFFRRNGIRSSDPQ